MLRKPQRGMPASELVTDCCAERGRTRREAAPRTHFKSQQACRPRERTARVSSGQPARPPTRYTARRRLDVWRFWAMKSTST